MQEFSTRSEINIKKGKREAGGHSNRVARRPDSSRKSYTEKAPQSSPVVNETQKCVAESI